MIKKRVVFLVIVFVFCIFMGRSISLDDSYELVKGKNFVNFENVNPFYVSDLVKLNPGIEVVSYSLDNFTFGYVNLFEGLGKNFVVKEGVYEIVVREDTTLVVPNNR